MSIVGLDFEIEEEMHMAIGFENGSVEVRSHRTGKQVHKVCVGSRPIQKLFYYDYRQTGVNE